MRSNPGKALIISILDFFKDRFDLHKDKEADIITINDISKGVEFRGTNLWILIFAVFIASIGLNVNSTAVVIGAMLISPLMGPLLGLGMGAGINDLQLISKSFKNLGVAVVISIATSTLYFIITPLHAANSELLARTTPTIWDVLIAFFGGLAGIIAGSRKEKSNAIPGVAIATALIPPLCTAGYAIATTQWYYLFGAMYLFFINSVFITTATFLIVQFMGYPRVKYEDSRVEKKVKRAIGIIVVVTMLPSIYLAYNIVVEAIFEQRANYFINKEVVFEDTQIITKELRFDGNRGHIQLTLFGKPLNDIEIAQLESKMKFYDLNSCELDIRQGYEKEDEGEVKMEDFHKMSEELKVGILTDLYDKNLEVLESKERKISFLEKELLKTKENFVPTDDISKELKVQDPKVKEFFLSDGVYYNLNDNQQDTLLFAFIWYKGKVYPKKRKQFEDWLKIRTKADSLRLIVY